MGSVVKKRRKKIRKHKYRKMLKKMRHKNKSRPLVVPSSVKSFK
jgi:hypothetical protein